MNSPTRTLYVLLATGLTLTGCFTPPEPVTSISKVDAIPKPRLTELKVHEIAARAAAEQSFFQFRDYKRGMVKFYGARKPAIWVVEYNHADGFFLVLIDDRTEEAGISLGE